MISSLIAPQAARRSGSYSVSDPEAAPLFGGDKTHAGVEVDEHEALTLPAMFRACDLMASHLAMLPLPVYQRTGDDDRERRREHVLDGLLNREANPEMSAFNMRRAWHLHTMLWGNGHLEAERRGRNVQSLWPLLPNQASLRRTPGLSGELRYDVHRTDGTTDVMDPADICHVTALSSDGLNGLGIIRNLARENIGLGLALMRYTEAFFGNNMRFGTILSTDELMDKKNCQNNLDTWKRAHQGPEASWKPVMLTGGLKPYRMAQDNEAAELIFQLTLSVQDVSRWTGVVPPLLMDLSRGTFTNIKELGMWHVKFSLTPWFKPYEQELNRKLFTEAELRAGYFVEFNAEGLLRGDPKLRAEFYRIMSEVAGMTPNEIRAKENMHSVEGGDKPSRPLNVAPLGNDDDDDDRTAPPPEPPPRRKRRSSADMRKQIAQAHTPLFEDVIARMEAIETRARGRATKAEKDVGAWAETFYSEHALKFRAAIIPAVDALGGVIRATLPDTILDAEWETFTAEFTKRLTQRQIDLSKANAVTGVALDDDEYLSPVNLFVLQAEERFGQ